MGNEHKGIGSCRSHEAAGNVMSIRRWTSTADGQVTAKLHRLEELIKECQAEGFKVVVFSYFLDVLDAVTARADGAYRIDGRVHLVCAISRAFQQLHFPDIASGIRPQALQGRFVPLFFVGNRVPGCGPLGERWLLQSDGGFVIDNRSGRSEFGAGRGFRSGFGPGAVLGCSGRPRSTRSSLA
ncbi:MAG: hypothetical protein ACI9N0_003004 [Ilumatobacter sp.]|jgi:hypothetical protein